VQQIPIANVQITKTHHRQFYLFDFRTLELGHYLVIGTCLPAGNLVIILFASNLHPLTFPLHCQCLLNLNINLPAAKPSELRAG
jgi:hypothetical protein